jgi:hypothetical protein
MQGSTFHAAGYMPADIYHSDLLLSMQLFLMITYPNDLATDSNDET